MAIVRDAESLRLIESTLAAQSISLLAAGEAEEGWDLVRRAGGHSNTY